MNETLPLFATLPTSDIHHQGRIYRPYRKGMEDGFDRVKNGERRPHGWDMYLFPGGYIVIDPETRAVVDSIRELPRAVRDLSPPTERKTP
jgi:hypothetical protein